MIHSIISVVVDTDVVSFLFKDHPVASAYRSILAGKSLALSLVTIAEIEYGMEAKDWGPMRRKRMSRFLSHFTTLHPDKETARIWARIKAGRQRKGRPISFADAWIAAAAIQFEFVLVTHNAADYEVIDDLTVVTAPAQT